MVWPENLVRCTYSAIFLHYCDDHWSNTTVVTVHRLNRSSKWLKKFLYSQCHRGLNLFSMLVTIIGFILIFIHAGGYSKVFHFLFWLRFSLFEQKKVKLQKVSIIFI